MFDAMYEKLVTPRKMLEYMKSVLEQTDPEYPCELRRKKDAIQVFKSHAGKDMSARLDIALDEENLIMGERLTFLYWLGVQQNYSCFADPESKLFLDLDYEQIHQEQKMNLIIGSSTRGIAAAPELFDVGEAEIYQILAYYSYLETIGYKLVHYLGFKFADEFLRKIVSAYKPDPDTIERYQDKLRQDLMLKNLP